MTKRSTSKRKPKMCALAYAESPTEIPPMLHLGASLAADGFLVEAHCVASSGADALEETHAPGFASQCMQLRTRSIFHRLFGHATRHRVVAGLQYALTYGEFVAKAVPRALRSGADLYEANSLPPLLPAVLAAKLRGKPVVYRAHELWSETHAKVRFAGLWRQLERALVPRCDQVITPEEHRSRIYRAELGARREPMTIRNCPPYLPPVRSTRLRDELARRGLPASTIVLYQGLLDSMRCIEEIAEATRHFDPGVVLVILGSGAGKWADPAGALAGHDRIVVLPRVPYRDLPPYTASADVGILLYRNDCRNNYYCAPNKVFEYRMMGLPVIASRFPGMEPLVEGAGVGLCVNPEDPHDIATAVNRLARDPEERQRMKANALRLSRERDNWELESRPLLARYRALATGRRDVAVQALAVRRADAPPSLAATRSLHHRAHEAKQGADALE